ncbi:putative Appr-1-p processing enzyme family protein [Rhizobium phage RHph_Y68]|uniref:Putative Appr-1-p processing enzyme family protein n=1 Tax=Rhizobium phage RHph_Y68 TaxID=2509787 RepID=A0A7S5R9Q1_9CAUD|nr:putative Appr-1-p processing enzyme family protein [Rhizobium phage RHph_Y68]QIG68114.1 putative Appr-1-p processing enzyme family protein [Rhizobium phage RHph_Y68]
MSLFDINEEATKELQTILENNGFIVERVHSPVVYVEELGAGLVRSFAGKLEHIEELFNDVRDKIFLYGIFQREGKFIVRFVKATEFKKR